MASSGNFPLWSPLIKGAVNLSKGNTRFDGTTSSRGAMTSFAVPTGTKFYVECLVTHATGYNIVFGVANPEFNVGTYDESDATMNGILFRANTSSSWDTCALTNGSRGSFGSDVGQTSARVLAMTVNRVDNEIKMYLDNSLQHTISISATEIYHIVCSFTGGANSSIHMNINGGHDSTGAGDFSAGGNADENGFGDFQNSPPSGFLAPSSANLPISDGIDPAQTDDNYPSKQFDVALYTGNASTNEISSLNFQPDLVWIKQRNGTAGHKFYDSTRGATKMIAPHNTDAEITVSDGLTSFDSDGFTLGSNSGSNGSSNTYTAWCWKCNGGTTTTNTEGATSNTLQANTEAGFSISQFSNGASATTIGHGLGVAPSMYVIKIASGGGGSWGVYHKSIGATKYVRWNSNAAAATNSSYFNDTEPTSTVLSVGSTWTGTTIMCYAWADVEGFQKFGSYEGNSNADGPFIYTGFRPRYWFFKEIDAADDWVAYDTARDTANTGSSKVLRYDSSAAEFDDASRAVDVLSNGLKIRTSNGTINTGGNTYIFGAWADVPFKYNNTF